MSNFALLQKFFNEQIKEVENEKFKINYQSNLKQDLSFLIASSYFQALEENKDLSREFLFLSCYYGLIDQAQTLEKIGELNSKKLTRERVRQIIDGASFLIKDKIDVFNIENFDNPYNKATSLVFEKINNSVNQYVRFSHLVDSSYFEGFKNNPKGLIAFLNDCGFKQITYKNDYFFYNQKLNREDLIVKIQTENKVIRKNKTLENMQNKAKTVTYIPGFLKAFLIQESKRQNLGLNNLYEKIFLKFIENHPYQQLEQIFPKNKMAPQNTNTQWEQVGLYIDKKVYDKIQNLIEKLKKNKRYVSSMGFLAQALIWYYNFEDKTLN